MTELVDVIEKKWCPRCREWGLPHDRTGLCLFCDGPMVDEPPKGDETMTATASASARTCKTPGHTDPPLQQFGKFGGLCAKCVAERKRDGNEPSSVTTVRNGTHAAAVRALLPHAKALDAAKRKLDTLPTNEKARAELAEAMRHVQASATPANLERLAAATKALAKDQPKRKKLQDTHDEALRAFKTKFAQLARELADA